MTDWIVAGLIIIGSGFSLLGAVGILRMPDLYIRTQAAAKSSTLGVSCIVLAAAIHFADVGVTTRALLVIAFLFLTVPVGAHMIGRAAYAAGVPLWDRTLFDELKDKEGGLSQSRRDAEER